MEHDFTKFDKLREFIIDSLRNSCELLKLELNPHDYTITIEYNIRLTPKKKKINWWGWLTNK